jgi:hypothetical protein
VTNVCRLSGEDRSIRPRGSYPYVMAFGRRTRHRDTTVDTTARRRGLGPFLRQHTIPIIGAVTPVGLIVVNIAAFIVRHLSEFRWTIAVLAFVSSIMLNSWAGLNIYRVVRRRRPEHALVHDRNQEVVLVGGMAVIIAIAFLTALFCYLGLNNPNDLPNGATFITGLLAFLVPILLQALFRRAYGRDRGDRSSLTSVGGLPSVSAPTHPPRS